MASLFQNLSTDGLANLSLEDLSNLFIEEESSNNQGRFVINSNRAFNSPGFRLLGVNMDNGSIGNTPDDTLTVRATKVESFDNNKAPSSIISSAIVLNKESQGASYAIQKAVRNV